MATIIKFPARRQAERAKPETAVCLGNTVVISFPGAKEASAELKTIMQAWAEGVASPAPAPALPPKVKRGETKEADQMAAMIAKVHIALMQLSHLPEFDDDKYRFMLQERWGVQSSTEMDKGQLHELLQELAALGFKSSRPWYARQNYAKWGQTALLAKIEAMLAEKGRVEGRRVPMEYAGGIVSRQTKGAVTSIYQASPRQLRAVIAALHGDGKRKGRRVR